MAGQARCAFNIVGIWDDPLRNEEHIKWVKRSYDCLSPYQARGVYINFMGGDETGGADAAFGVDGSHIDRLRELKLRYDPKNAFATIFNLDQDSLIRLIRAKRWR